MRYQEGLDPVQVRAFVKGGAYAHTRTIAAVTGQKPILDANDGRSGSGDGEGWQGVSSTSKRL